MINFTGLIANVAVIVCLAPLMLYIEHGYVPAASLRNTYSFIFLTLPRRLLWATEWTMFKLFQNSWYLPSYISKITSYCRRGLCGWQSYLYYWLYEIKLSFTTYADLIEGIATLTLYLALGLTLWSWWISEGSFLSLSSVAQSTITKVIRFIPEELGILSKANATEEKYDVNDAYGDPKALTTGLLADLKQVGLKAGRRDLLTLLQVALAKGKPIDDRLMTVRR